MNKCVLILGILFIYSNAPDKDSGNNQIFESDSIPYDVHEHNSLSASLEERTVPSSKLLDDIAVKNSGTLRNITGSFYG